MVGHFLKFMYESSNLAKLMFWKKKTCKKERKEERGNVIDKLAYGYNEGLFWVGYFIYFKFRPVFFYWMFLIGVL